MNAVKTAEDKKYVLMNAPKDKLEEIIAVLPGMKSPTVMQHLHHFSSGSYEE